MYFFFLPSRVVSKMITTQNSWKMRFLAWQELCHGDRINLKVASFTHFSSQATVEPPCGINYPLPHTSVYISMENSILALFLWHP